MESFLIQTPFWTLSLKALWKDACSNAPIWWLAKHSLMIPLAKNVFPRVLILMTNLWQSQGCCLGHKSFVVSQKSSSLLFNLVLKKSTVDPWMLMFKHDSTNLKFPLCSQMFERDEDVIQNKPDINPSLLNFYSSLHQLEYLRDGEDDLTLRLFYPRSSKMEQILWKQSSSLFEEAITGFELLFGSPG